MKLPSHEVYTYKQSDPIFYVGWLYSSIIDSFFHKLSMELKDALVTSSELGLQAARNITNATNLQRRFPTFGKMRAIILPANLNNMQWIVVIAVLPTEQKILFYDPMQTSIARNRAVLLSQVLSDMRIVFPT